MTASFRAVKSYAAPGNRAILVPISLELPVTILSLYIPVYNAAAFLPRLLDSLAGLPSDAVEVLFVDDASTDDGPRLIEAFVARRANTRIVCHERNRGEGAASNTALEHCAGRYVQRCDADDQVIAAGMMKAVELARNGDADAVFQGYIEHTKDGREVLQAHTLPPESRSAARALWRDWTPALWTVMARRSLATRPGLRFQEIRIGVDQLWLTECASAFRPEACVFSPEPSYHYYRREGSLSSSTNAAPHAEAMLELLREKQVLGMRLAQQGIIDRDELPLGLYAVIARLLRSLRRSGRHSRALAEYHRLRAVYGATRAMKREFWRSWPLGWLGLLFPGESSQE